MKTWMLVGLLVVLAGCAAPKVVVESLDATGRSVPAEAVAVLDAVPNAAGYSVIARISVAGVEPAYPTARGRTGLEAALRARAGALGADAVVVTRDYGVGGEPPGYTGLTTLHTRHALTTGGVTMGRVRTIKALAIVYDTAP